MPFLEKFCIRYLGLGYTYSDTGDGIKFQFKGNPLLGELELALNFDHGHTVGGWTPSAIKIFSSPPSPNLGREGRLRRLRAKMYL